MRKTDSGCNELKSVKRENKKRERISMNMQKTITTLIAACALQAMVLHAQTNLFRVQFRAVCAPSTGRGASSTMRNADLMRQCVGTDFSNRQLNRNFALVYNSDADSIQVVAGTNGEPVCDVFQFQGGTVVTNGNRLERITFVFVPGQSDSVGSAVLRERATGSDVNSVNRARISARIQFSMPELLSQIGTNDNSSTDQTANTTADMSSTNNVSDGSSTNVDGSSAPPVQFIAASAEVAPTNSNVQVCSGTFTVGRRFNPTESQNTGGSATNEVSAATGGIQGTNVNASTGTTTTTVVTNSITSGMSSSALLIPPGI